MSDPDADAQNSASDLFTDLVKKAKFLILNWSVYAALGTFLLYLFGYLSLRFRLSVYGIRTDLPILDENYLFAGAYFLVYVVSFIPILLLILAILFAVVYAILLLVGHLWPSLTQVLQKAGKGIWSWWSIPTTFMLTAIMLSIAVIQFLMRHCFLLSDTLLLSSLPEHEWLHSIVFTENSPLTWIFFPGILVSVVLSVLFLRIGASLKPQTVGSRILWGILACCTGIQVLLLPVNYGMLFASRSVPRLTSLGNKNLLQEGRDAWLLWSTKESLTFVLRDNKGCRDERRLITVPRKKVNKVEVASSDQIFRVFFSDDRTLAKMKHRVRNDMKSARIDPEDTPSLVQACEKGHFQTAKFLIRDHCDVNAVNETGDTALIVSAKKGCTKLVELLLKNGADVSLTDRSGKTALTWAVEKNLQDVKEVLAAAQSRK